MSFWWNYLCFVFSKWHKKADNFRIILHQTKNTKHTHATTTKMVTTTLLAFIIDGVNMFQVNISVKTEYQSQQKGLLERALEEILNGLD